MGALILLPTIQNETLTASVLSQKEDGDTLLAFELERYIPQQIHYKIVNNDGDPIILVNPHSKNIPEGFIKFAKSVVGNQVYAFGYDDIYDNIQFSLSDILRQEDSLVFKQELYNNCLLNLFVETPFYIVLKTLASMAGSFYLPTRIPSDILENKKKFDTVQISDEKVENVVPDNREALKEARLEKKISEISEKKKKDKLAKRIQKI